MAETILACVACCGALATLNDRENEKGDLHDVDGP